MSRALCIVGGVFIGLGVNSFVTNGSFWVVPFLISILALFAGILVTVLHEDRHGSN